MTKSENDLAAFHSSPLIIRAMAMRKRLVNALSGDPYDRAADLLARLDWQLENAERQIAVITGPCPNCSVLAHWLHEWAAAVDAACWRERYPRAAESYVPAVGGAA